MERDDVLPVTGGSPSGIRGGWRLLWACSPWREVGCPVNPTLGQRALGTKPRGLVWRVPARLGGALCSQQLAKNIDSSFCWRQD